MSGERRIRIALQKSGRLADDSLGLLRNCGLHVSKGRDRLFCRVKELPIDVLMVRDDDIPGFVADGICDLGIVGENVFAEKKTGENGGVRVAVLDRLGFSRCRLSIAVPEGGKISEVGDLNGAVIATSYPRLLEEFLRRENVQAKPLIMMGSVEVAPRLKIADAICDIVASGATLAANNLREIAVVLESEALLIGAAAGVPEEKASIITRLRARMQGALRADDSKYIMLHADVSALPEIVSLLPGAESPTVLPLQGKKDKVAVHSVCREAVFWETMERLKSAGASSILVMPIEKMME